MYMIYEFVDFPDFSDVYCLLFAICVDLDRTIFFIQKIEMHKRQAMRSLACKAILIALILKAEAHCHERLFIFVIQKIDMHKCQAMRPEACKATLIALILKNRSSLS